ncbi:MAG: ABC transporter substrate-binding protein [Acidobacteriia bacterium]|nr:ABC transporter substrate-binding protein [Terriglobia bacterium]
MYTKVWIGIAVVVAAIAGIFAIVHWKPRTASEIQVGAILPLTGDVASYGVAVQQGIELAVDKENRSGGVNGRRLSILYEDDKGEPKQGVAAAQKLISMAHVQVIIGAVPSSVTLAIAPIAERSRVILFSPASSSPKLTTAGDYIFRNYPSDELEGRLVAQFAVEHGFSTAAILTINNDYGNGLNDVFLKTYVNQGGRVLLNDKYSQGSGDYRTILTKIKGRSPKCVFIVGYGKELGTIVRQARELGLEVQFLSTVNFQDTETLVTGGKAVEGTIYSSAIFDAESLDPKINEFISTFKSRFGKDPDVWSAHGYDALMIIVEAMRKRGTDADSVKQALYEIRDFPGVAGKTSIDQNGDPIKAARFMTIKDAHFTPFTESNPPRQK